MTWRFTMTGWVMMWNSEEQTEWKRKWKTKNGEIKWKRWRCWSVIKTKTQNVIVFIFPVLRGDYHCSNFHSKHILFFNLIKIIMHNLLMAHVYENAVSCKNKMALISKLKLIKSQTKNEIYCSLLMIRCGGCMHFLSSVFIWWPVGHLFQ